jgi:hypothetical protein
MRHHARARVWDASVSACVHACLRVRVCVRAAGRDWGGGGRYLVLPFESQMLVLEACVELLLCLRSLRRQRRLLRRRHILQNT